MLSTIIVSSPPTIVLLLPTIDLNSQASEPGLGLDCLRRQQRERERERETALH